MGRLPCVFWIEVYSLQCAAPPSSRLGRQSQLCSDTGSPHQMLWRVAHHETSLWAWEVGGRMLPCDSQLLCLLFPLELEEAPLFRFGENSLHPHLWASFVTHRSCPISLLSFCLIFFPLCFFPWLNSIKDSRKGGTV